MLILINNIRKFKKFRTFRKILIPDILFLNQWEVHQNGPSHKYTECDARMIGRIVPEKHGVKFTPPPGFHRCTNTSGLIRVK